jgi:L-threonylcarbamoyladenylate synthase
VLAAPDGERLARTLAEQGHRVGWLTGNNVEGLPPGVDVVVMPDGPDAYAAQLYAVLHALDGKGVTQIIVDEVPADEAWLAVRDRLQRAAVQQE